MSTPKPRLPKTSAKPKKIQAEYDFTRPLNKAGGKKRRLPHVENRGEEHILDAWKRLEGVNLSRDLLRNAPLIHGLARTLRSQVIGDYGKVVFNDSGEWFKQAQDWANQSWGKHTDFIDGSSFRDCLQLLVTSIHFEGDVVAVFDDGQLTDGTGTGKIAFFETDQICNLVADEFKPYADQGMSQQSGVILDRFGRKAGIVVSRKRGQTETKAEDAFVLLMDPADPDSAPWRHISQKFRLRQLRGVADSFCTLATAIDSAELLSAELGTAKLGATKYASVIESPEEVSAPTGFDDTGPDGTIDEDALIEEEEEDARAEALESYTGGHVDYLPANSSVVFDPPNRPNPSLEPFLNYTTDITGLAHGVFSAYSRGKVSTSYTAFRGELVLTFMSLRTEQKFLEGAFSDWAVTSAIRWAIRTGQLPEGPDGWEKKISFTYPKMPSVDEQKEMAATQTKLKLGLTNYRELLGPAYKEHLAQLAEELAYAKSLGLPLSVFETVAGAPAAEPSTDPTEREETNDED